MGGQVSNEFNFAEPIPSFDGRNQPNDYDEVPTDAIDAATGNRMVFEIYGVADLNRVPVDQLNVTIGGRHCTNIQINPCSEPTDGRTCSSGACCPENTAATTYSTLGCLMPEGTGAGNVVLIAVTGATSRADSGLVVSYGAPRVTRVITLDAFPGLPAGSDLFVADRFFDSEMYMQAWIDFEAAGSTGTLPALPRPRRGIPTTGCRVRLEGINFGTPLLATPLVALPEVEVEHNASLGHMHTHNAIEVTIGAGAGTVRALTVAVTDQFSDGRRGLRYGQPIISSIEAAAFVPSNPEGPAPTAGDTLVRVTGMNFGPAGPADPTLMITIGGRPCVVDAVRDPWTAN